VTQTEQTKLEEFRRESTDEAGRVDEEAAFRLWLRWKAITDLYFLGYEILGWRHATSRSGKRRRVDPKLHRWLASLMQREEDCLILVPRLHLKSTWMKLRIVQLILANPNVRILLVSVTARLVMFHLRDIKSILANPIIREIFPELPDPGPDYCNYEKSTLSELIVRRFPQEGEREVTDPQVLAVGMGARITGFHCDYAFLDDIIDDSTTTTPEQMMKSRTFWAYLQPILETDAQVIITGTRYHPNDLYQTIISEGHFRKNRIFIRRCREAGKPIYGSWYSNEDLDRLEKRMGSSLFNAQMNNDPSPLSERVFPPPQPVYDHLPKDSYRYFLAIDPAPTVQNYSDPTGFAIGALNKANGLFIERGFALKLKPEALCQKIVDLHAVWRFEKIGIELGLQEALKPLLARVIIDWESGHHHSLGLVIDANVVGIKVSKENKARRISSTYGALVREGKCLVRMDQLELLRQMDDYTGRGEEVDDIVDACSHLFSIMPTFAAHWRQPAFLRRGWTIQDFRRKPQSSWWGQFVSGRT
jgi:hypothetical protein